MRSGNTFHFVNSASVLLRTRWIGPYLLVPPMMAFLIYAETFLSGFGIGSFSSYGQRSILALWNGAFLLTLIGGIKSCLFFSRTWGSGWFLNSLSLPASRASGFWGPFLAVLSVVSGVFLLTTGAVVAALPHGGRLPLVYLTVQAYLPVIWAVCIGAFLGILTSGTAGALFFSALLILGFSAGLPSVSVPAWLQYVIPPLGRVMAQSFRYPSGALHHMMLLAHSTVLLAAARTLYGLGCRRR